MKTALQLIEQCDPFSTVMVVRRSETVPDNLVELLTDAGLNVLGPVDTAARALVIAGQSHVDLALVDPELAGKRNGYELARRLEDTWGVKTLVLSEA